MGLFAVAEVLVGETVDAALEAVDQLLEGVEVPSRGLADEEARRNGGRWSTGVAHRELVEPRLDMHQR